MFACIRKTIYAYDGAHVVRTYHALEYSNYNDCTTHFCLALEQLNMTCMHNRSGLSDGARPNLLMHKLTLAQSTKKHYSLCKVD